MIQMDEASLKPRTYPVCFGISDDKLVVCGGQNYGLYLKDCVEVNVDTFSTNKVAESQRGFCSTDNSGIAGLNGTYWTIIKSRKLNLFSYKQGDVSPTFDSEGIP